MLSLFNNAGWMWTTAGVRIQVKSFWCPWNKKYLFCSKWIESSDAHEFIWGIFFSQYLRTNLPFVKTIFSFKTKFTAKLSHFFPYFLLSFFLLSFLFLLPSLSLLLFLNLIIWRLINIIGIPSFIFAIFFFSWSSSGKSSVLGVLALLNKEWGSWTKTFFAQNCN